MKTSTSLDWKAGSDRLLFNSGHGFVLFFIACLTLVALVRWIGPAAPDNITARAEQIRVLRFVDQPDGSIQVIDAVTGADVHNFQGEQGFVRGTLRALVRGRRLQGMGADQPFELSAHDAGRLSLRDPATGTSIALESFGSNNIGVFARLLR